MDTDYADTQEQDEQPPHHDRPLPPNTLPTAADMPPAAPIDIIPADTILPPTMEHTPDTLPDAPPEAPPPSEPDTTLTPEPLIVPLAPVAEPRYPTRDRKPPNRLSLMSAFHITAKRALREDPATARPAIEAELRTLIAKGVFRPIKQSTLTEDQRRSVIRSQLNVTQKYLPTTDGREESRTRSRHGWSAEETAKIEGSIQQLKPPPLLSLPLPFSLLHR